MQRLKPSDAVLLFLIGVSVLVFTFGCAPQKPDWAQVVGIRG